MPPDRLRGRGRCRRSCGGCGRRPPLPRRPPRRGCSDRRLLRADVRLQAVGELLGELLRDLRQQPSGDLRGGAGEGDVGLHLHGGLSSAAGLEPRGDGRVGRALALLLHALGGQHHPVRLVVSFGHRDGARERQRHRAELRVELALPVAVVDGLSELGAGHARGDLLDVQQVGPEPSGGADDGELVLDQHAQLTQSSARPLRCRELACSKRRRVLPRTAPGTPRSRSRSCDRRATVR